MTGSTVALLSISNVHDLNQVEEVTRLSASAWPRLLPPLVAVCALSAEDMAGSGLQRASRKQRRQEAEKNSR